MVLTRKLSGRNLLESKSRLLVNLFLDNLLGGAMVSVISDFLRCRFFVTAFLIDKITIEIRTFFHSNKICA